MAPTEGESQPKVQRKKRLSRKEQKARKKQRHNIEKTTTATKANPVTVDQPPENDDEDLSTYVPTPIPDSVVATSASLGKWFPSAKVIKSTVLFSNDQISQTDATASLVLFYQYATPHWPEVKVDQFVAYLSEVAKRRVLGGRIRVAPEGVNATVSSVDSPTQSARTTLRHFCRDLKQFDPKVFQDTDFKFIDKVAPDRHFKDLKLLPVKELVFYGISSQDAPLDKGGVHLDARDFHEKLQQPGDETVVIDVRNHYEATIGRFDGQATDNATGGAEYVDPKMRKSTDFPKWLAKPETKEKLKDKTVLMYCTGGVRCERASAYLNQQMGKDVKGIFQLQGGIERYLQAFPDGGLWRGKNFVFDKREAISADNREGDGGVIRKGKSEQRMAECSICNEPWDRYVGKKKCYTCGVPVLVCTACMSRKERKDTKARCPLCVEENITVPATEVEYTSNGVSSRRREHGIEESTVDSSGPKAADSVLKWGGGHAARKKQKHRLQHKPCRFGSDCNRPDCFFSHPEPARANKTSQD